VGTPASANAADRTGGAARFGLEEEFVLLDDSTLIPLAMGEGERERLTGPGTRGSVVAEYLTCQLECITEPARTAADAVEQVRALRAVAAAHAATHGGTAAPSGTAFVSAGGVVVSPSAHYDAVAAHLGEITREHQVQGLHVHVEVPDEEQRVQALNRLRAWLPLLHALTVNAPFTRGRHSGFESWRNIIIRRLPTSWCPPQFRDAADYHARVERLVALGAITEPSSLAWAVRLSERYPTVEARVFDAQLTADDSVFAAQLTRAVAYSDVPAAGGEQRMDEIDAALWAAARHGLDASVIDPASGEIAAARTVATRMLDLLGPALDEFGDRDFVAQHLERILADGTGAERQRRAYASGGVDALRDLYRAGMDS
jgi:carboxylate-amine ligase